MAGTFEDLTPKAKASIYRGFLNYHLGKVFSHKEVISRNPYYILRVKLKRLYWRLRRPFYHRHCKTCKEYRQQIRDFEEVSSNAQNR